MKHAKIIDHITTWLKDYALDNGLNGFVLGISGGVDSALVSTLCAKTELPLLCLEMPIHQSAQEVTRASEHINQLKKQFSRVDNLEIDLTATFDEMTKALPEAENKENLYLALANTRARLRMTTLYYFAGLKGLIVAGTGNKIEDFGIGFYTKYGDGGVDINPIADLTKTEVYELARFLKISPAILEARPTDGLFGDERSDEDQIGATYPELEWAMNQYEAGKIELDFQARELEVFKIYKHRHEVNQHKWKPIPVCKIPEELL
ncbi:MAG TPA: NAD(+) synthase [Flavobacteriaceae bacterium]|nr:NAD(+) synthase [Flavobacteriaceae bacterium]